MYDCSNNIMKKEWITNYWKNTFKNFWTIIYYNTVIENVPSGVRLDSCPKSPLTIALASLCLNLFLKRSR